MPDVASSAQHMPVVDVDVETVCCAFYTLSGEFSQSVSALSGRPVPFSTPCSLFVGVSAR
eukprot:365608-Chlamydomonas_euryale.AAC.3